MGLPMISCSYFVHGMTGFPMNIIHMNRSLYDQLFLYLVMAYLVFLWTAFLYLRSYVCVPIFIHGINGLPISVHRIIGFLMNGLPIIAFLYLRSYDCVFLYTCLPVERGGSFLTGALSVTSRAPCTIAPIMTHRWESELWVSPINQVLSDCLHEEDWDFLVGQQTIVRFSWLVAQTRKWLCAWQWQ